jgi:hypothetical protein
MMTSSDDVYRVDNFAAHYVEDVSDSSDDEIMNVATQRKEAIGEKRRPPPISTDFDTSMIDGDCDDDDDEGQEVVIGSDRHVHFQDPKRSQSQTPYPVQSLRTATARGSALEHETEKEGINKVDATPAFLRRAARDMNGNAAAARVINPQPPNTLPMLRDNRNKYNNDLSFVGADASALDGTFISIRDLNEDDDVPSIDNDKWVNSTFDKQSDVSIAATKTKTE